MPVYEYWCPDCRTRQEILQPRFNSDPPACPKCGGKSLQRRFSTFMMQRSYKAVYDDILSDSQLMRGMMNNDPQALAAWNNERGGACSPGVPGDAGEDGERRGAFAAFGERRSQCLSYTKNRSP